MVTFVRMAVQVAGFESCLITATSVQHWQHAHPSNSHAPAHTNSVDPSHRSKISEPCPSVRAINAMTIAGDRRWLAVAEFMVGGQQVPQV